MAGGKRFGDRSDGRRIRTLEPLYGLIPYIMRVRSDSQNFYEDRIDIGHTENYLRRKRKDMEINLSFLHVLVAAIVRTIALRPGLNRFIAGRRIYARNEIIVSLAIKKELKQESPETVIRFRFEPTDTLFDIAKKINEKVEENKALETQNGTDNAARLFMLCPSLLIRFLVFAVRVLDHMGIAPRALLNVSPFHSSVFITDLGSLGIQPVYHHLYDFGTTSIFIAFGAKSREKSVDSAGSVIEKKYVGLKVVTDERTVDGHYYASAFKLYKSFVQHPERLETPPEKVEYDID
jgi:hypothetical protein